MSEPRDHEPQPLNESDAPVSSGDRVIGMDVLRGFAVLAIFAVNIKIMVQPTGFYMNLTVWPGQFDPVIAGVLAFVVDDKWRTIFTGLFGAGLVLMAEKTKTAGGNVESRLRMRMVWLLVFGVIHMVGLWLGDILTMYAVTGFVALLFWKKRIKALWTHAFWWGLAGTVMLAGVMGAMILGLQHAPYDMAEQVAMLWGTDPEYNADQTATALGPFWGPIAHRAGEGPIFVLGSWLMGMGPLVLANMLAGMALWKNGYLRGAWSVRAYAITAGVGLALAYGLDAWRMVAFGQSDWAFETFLVFTAPNIVNGFAGAMGYSALIMLLVKLGVRLAPVAAVGRMAFTNYITCTLVGTTIGVGHGFGRFGDITLLECMGIVIATWTALLIISPLWLKYFRFGPLEWLWRSLTYGRVQPLFAASRSTGTVNS